MAVAAVASEAAVLVAAEEQVAAKAAQRLQRLATAALRQRLVAEVEVAGAAAAVNDGAARRRGPTRLRSLQPRRLRPPRRTLAMPPATWFHSPCHLAPQRLLDHTRCVIVCGGEWRRGLMLLRSSELSILYIAVFQHAPRRRALGTRPRTSNDTLCTICCVVQRFL